MFVTWISFRGTLKSFWDLTDVSAQSWYKVRTCDLVNSTFKISLIFWCVHCLGRFGGKPIFWNKIKKEKKISGFARMICTEPGVARVNKVTSASLGYPPSAFNKKVYSQIQGPLRECRSIRSGFCRLPYYCAPPVCVPAVIGGLAVWRHYKPKTKNSQRKRITLHSLIVELFRCMFDVMFVTHISVMMIPTPPV